jgi:hypothetical protein
LYKSLDNGQLGFRRISSILSVPLLAWVFINKSEMGSGLAGLLLKRPFEKIWSLKR